MSWPNSKTVLLGPGSEHTKESQVHRRGVDWPLSQVEEGMVVKGHEVSTQVFLISRGGGPHLFLPVHQLPHCVPDFLAGVSVTSELLDLIKLRYSDSRGRVSFPSLVCLLMRLEAMSSKCHPETITLTREHSRGPGMHSGSRLGQGLSSGMGWSPAEEPSS